MNEEELFCKLFPEYAVNGKPLSPYFDLFESGYEQAEKRIAELEHQLTHRNCLDCSNHSSKLRMRNLELEKENTELKRLKRECETSLCRAEYQYNYEQLTKAKELIKKFLLWENAWHNKTESKYELLKQAEQFLSEVEK